MLDSPFGDEQSSNLTSLRIMFGSSEVQVEAEKEAASFSSLVADCGGTLGLFIGFNFMMLWEIIVFLADKSRILTVIKVKIFNK